MPELSPSGIPQTQVGVLLDLYSATHDRLRAIVENPKGRTLGSREFRQARAAQQISQIDTITAQLGLQARGWAGAVAPQAYRDGITRASTQAVQAGVRKSDVAAIPASFASIDRDAVNVLAKEIAADLHKAAGSMGDDAKRVLRTTAQNAISEADIDKILAGGIIEGTPVATQKALREALERVAGEEIEINGRTYKTKDYAELVAVTKTRQAMVKGQHNRLRRIGLDLVAIIGAFSSTFCTAFLGQVFSLSGSSSKYPSLASLPGGGPPFHPRCSKSTRPYLDSLATEKQQESAEGLDDAQHLLNKSPAAAQRAYKDLQLQQQVKENYGSGWTPADAIAHSEKAKSGSVPLNPK